MIERLRTRYREGGVMGIVDAVANHLPGVRYCSVYSVYRLPLADVRSIPPADAELRVERIDDPQRIDDFLAVREKRERFEQRFASGDVGYVAWSEGRPVGYFWLHFSRCPVEERFGYTLQLRDGDVYAYDGYVIRESRGQGVLRALHRKAGEDLLATTDRQSFASVIEDANLRSIRACTWLGYRHEDRFCALEVAGRARNFRLG